MLSFLYKTYQLIVALPLGLLLTIIISITTSVGCAVGNPNFWGYWPMRIWSVCICRLLLLPVEVVGRENLEDGKNYVFIANHQGAFDIFLIAGFLHMPFRWLMKKSLRSVPFVGWACECAGFIFVDRGSRSGIINTIRSARDTLKTGASVVIFPEGARSFTGHMGKFRKGSFLIAKQLNLPLVPLTIDGSFDVLPRQLGFSFVRRHKMRLTIHKPIVPNDSAINISYNIIMGALPPRHQGYVENPDQ